MYRTKRILCLLVLVGLVALLAACGGGFGSTVSEAKSLPVKAEAPDTAAEDEMSLDEQLIEAVNAGGLTEVERLLAEGANADAVEGDDFFTNPILRSAVEDGSVELTRALIENGADVNARDSKGNSVLRYAVTEAHPEIVAILLEAGADASALQADDEGLLPMAVATGDLEIVRMLLDAGVGVNDEAHFHPLGRLNISYTGPAINVAAAFGYNDIVQLLIDHGADVNQPVERPEVGHWQPISYAAMANQVETIDLLVANGAEIEGTTDAGNPLVIAATKGHPEATQKLIDLGADVNRRDEAGNVALRAARNSGNEDVVQTLLDAGAEE